MCFNVCLEFVLIEYGKMTDMEAICFCFLLMISQRMGHACPAKPCGESPRLVRRQKEQEKNMGRGFIMIFARREGWAS